MRHGAVVALVIVAAQVQDTVQGENLYFLGGGVSEFLRVLRGDLSGDGDVAGVARFDGGQGRKRQDIGGLILAAKAAVQRFQFAAGSDQDVDRGAQSGGVARPNGKAIESAFAEARDAFLQNDQCIQNDVLKATSCPRQS